MRDRRLPVALASAVAVIVAGLALSGRLAGPDQATTGTAGGAAAPAHTSAVTGSGATRPASAATASASPLPGGSPSTATSPGNIAGIHASGNRLVDAGSAPIRLIGANMSGTETVCAQNWSHDPFGGQPEADPRTFSALRSWGVNAVRIPLNEDCWLGINGVEIGGADYQSAIVGLVHGLRAAGLYVVVDLHWSAPGAQRALAQNPAPDEDHSPAFWASVAATFRGDGGVIFDLFNEPYYYWIEAGGPDQWTCLMQGCTLTQFVTGGQPYSVSTPWRSAGMNQLISVVRAAGAANLILVSGVDWANDLSGWLSHRPNDGNVAAGWHSYPAQGCSPQACWEAVIAPLQASVPVVVGETGDSSKGTVDYLPAFLAWCDHQGIGYLAWTWNAWADPKNVLVSDMLTGAPTAGEGVFFRNHLLGLG